jgi:uncharacterized membrane protein YkvA (DUF1232 family)
MTVSQNVTTSQDLDLIRMVIRIYGGDQMEPFGLKRARSRAKRLVQDPQRLILLINEAVRKLANHKETLTGVMEDLEVVFRLIRGWIKGEYKEVSRGTILILVAAVIYFLMPIDAIIDYIPVIGFMDDITVIGLAIAAAKGELEKFRQWENRKQGSSAPPEK